MSWPGLDEDDLTGPTYPLQCPTFPHYRAPFPEWCNAGRPTVAGESVCRCRNGHPVMAASEFCFTCRAPITAAAAAPAEPRSRVPAGTTRDKARPHPARTMMLTLLAGAAVMAVGVALIAVVVVSLI